MEVISKLYSSHYHVKGIQASPADQGHYGVKRNRLYLILTLKALVEEVVDPVFLYQQITKYIQRFVQTQPQDCSSKT